MSDMLRGTINEAGFGAVGDDSKVWAEFRMHPVTDAVASKEAGRTIKRDVPYIKIVQPGESRLSVYDQPATNDDVARFPRQWQAFQAGQDQGVQGSPLSLLFPDNPSIVENLKSIGIRTIEQLSGLNDTQIQNVGMGGRQWVEKAKAYLAQASNGQEFHAVTSRLEKLELEARGKDERIQALEAALAAAAVDPEQKRGPGRPRKEQAA